MRSLRRETSGSFHVKDAWTIAQLEDEAWNKQLPKFRERKYKERRKEDEAAVQQSVA